MSEKVLKGDKKAKQVQKRRNVKIVFEWIETKINVRSAPV